MAALSSVVARRANHCPECDAFVKTENLPGHLRKAHGKSEEAGVIERAAPRARKRRVRRPLPLWAPILVILVVAGVGAGIYLGSGPPPSPPPLTDMCVQHTGLGIHWHVQLNITIDSVPYTIPANIGIVSNTCYRPLHTHKTDGVIHIELTSPRPVYLRDFFEIWGQPFSSTRILGYTTDAAHEIVLTVNGSPSSAYENLPLQNGQSVRIAYRQK